MIRSLPVADLTALCSTLPVDAPIQVQAEMAGLWAVIGEGRLTDLAADRLSIAGEITAIEPGPFSLSVVLADGGAAQLVWRDITGSRAAWFDYDDGVVITVSLAGRAGELKLWPGDGGVYVRLAGAVKAQLWLGL